MENIKKLKEEVEKIHSQFYIFYELTKAMKTTLSLEEISYIALTGLAAHQGLGFNQAILFLADEENKKIKGFMGIGPMASQEADAIWKNIENHQMSLYDLIRTYHRIKEGKKPKFMEFAQGLSFPLGPESGFIYEALFEKGPLYIRENKVNQLKNDPLIAQLNLENFIISSLWIRNNPAGIILVDNSVRKRILTNDDLRIFNMFVEQLQGAIENSQIFKDTLTKAHTDHLTGLWNYGYFQYRLDEELLVAKSKKYPLSIMMIDLDNFKRINDTYGHLKGDKMLKKVGEFLKGNSRKADILCRYGGEEFSMILPSTNKQEAYFLAERIRKAAEKKKILGNKLTVSIGVSSYLKDAKNKSGLIRKADRALYRAKKSGKNKTVLT